MHIFRGGTIHPIIFYRDGYSEAYLVLNHLWMTEKFQYNWFK